MIGYFYHNLEQIHLSILQHIHRSWSHGRRLVTICHTIMWLSIPFLAIGQNEKGNEYGVLNVNITYGAHLPGADWAERYGFHFSVGGGLEYITYPGNFIFGVESSYIFGGTVHENVLEPLQNEEGEIIGNDLQFADVNLRQRGLYTGFYVGKLFNIIPKNERAGIRVTLGGGYLWHRIRIQDDFDTAPQFFGEYSKGYDRLTDGLGLTQFIGYQSLAKDRRANFMIGLEFMQAFTSSVREFNWDTRAFTAGERRLDLRFGIRAAWTIPFYISQPPETIFY